jgi:predicted P-loop ATPase/GTPase
MMSPQPKEIFLSHASNDRAKADAVAKVLRAHGLKVWYSKTHIAGAELWHDEIGKALKRCNWFVLLLSRKSVSSTWVKRELHNVLNQPRYEKHIIPVLLEKCDFEKLSWTLSDIQMISMHRFTKQTWTALLRALKSKFNPAGMLVAYAKARPAGAVRASVAAYLGANDKKSRAR